MNDAQPISVDVSALIDADWPEWRSALEDIRREYGDEGVRALLRRLQEYSIDQGVTLSGRITEHALHQYAFSRRAASVSRRPRA